MSVEVAAGHSLLDETSILVWEGIRCHFTRRQVDARVGVTVSVVTASSSGKRIARSHSQREWMMHRPRNSYHLYQNCRRFAALARLNQPVAFTEDRKVNEW